MKYIRDGRAPIPKSKITSRVMSANVGKDTKPELLLRKALRYIGIPGYRLHWKKVPGRPDITYPGGKIAIFVNGCYWHRCPYCNLPLPKSHTDFWAEKFKRNKERDDENIRLLKAEGWKIIVLWECEIKRDVMECAERVRNLVCKIDS
ncbi:very short patch repair endonuclease [Methanococcoides burtonii]|uniref:very short patch repair endonuclease n=1 Tax=Methanococcoides burtonii TaxID=29291 RepID=UPI0018DC2D16|nr:very short patch repair endonuclease [Methanococcoides burtonii]